MRYFFRCAIFLTIVMCYPALAYAYLDPNSGSMLMYALFGIAATVLYALRGVFYRIKNALSGGVGKTGYDVGDAEIVIYSEGNKYWNVFASIVEAFDRMGIKCAYITPDVEDAGLQYESENVVRKSFSSEMRAITFMNNVKTNIVLTTTPQLDVYMLKRSRHVKHYSHVIHSPIDAAFYEKHAFDYYDSVLCSGPHQIKSIRTLEKKRGMPAKRLFETGCTYYDIMSRQISQGAAKTGNGVTVLYAPSWGKRSSLVEHGIDMLLPMIDKGYDVIFRPHPQSFISDTKVMKEITETLRQYQHVTIDKNRNGVESMTKSHILVTDFSGILFDYLFLFEKPAIAIGAETDTGGYEAEDLDEVWEMTVRKQLCRIVDNSDISRLGSIIQEELENHVNREEIISVIKSESVYNFGQSGEIAAKQISKINEEYK